VCVENGEDDRTLQIATSLRSSGNQPHQVHDDSVQRDKAVRVRPLPEREAAVESVHTQWQSPMSSRRDGDDEDDMPAWQPPMTRELPFNHPISRAMLPTHASPAAHVVNMKSIGAESGEVGAVDQMGRRVMTEAEYSHRTVRMLGRLGMGLSIVVVAVLILVGLQSAALWRISVRADSAMAVASQYVTSQDVNQAIYDTLGSVHNVHQATASAAHAGATVDSGLSKAVEALNTTSALLVQANTLLAQVVSHPAIQLSLGGNGGSTGR
jgi:hypothetical protein